MSAADATTLAALHPARDYNYLATLANAIVGGLPVGRTVADMVALADPAHHLSAASVVTLLNPPPTGLPAAFTTAHIVTLVGSVQGLNAHQIVQLVNCLYPQLFVVRTLRLLNVLKADGLDGLEITSLIQRLNAAGQTGLQIETLIRRLRGHLQVVAPPDPSAFDVTTPLGEKVLSGVEIASHLTHTLAAGRAAATIGKSYPTGQDFTARSDDQLWTDCSLGVITHLDVNTLANETPAQKQIRQKLALKELMRRYPGSAELVQRIFDHDEGQTARPFVSVVDEDTYSGGHIVDRHVMNGTGTIPDILALARRVCTKVPPCGVAVSAFNNVAEANAAIAATLNATLFANWNIWRRNLTQANVLLPIVEPSTAGIRLRKTDNPKHLAYPAPFNPATYAPRPLIGPAPYGVPPLGLTHYAPVNHVRVVIRASNHANAHGWAVYTAYPDR